MTTTPDIVERLRTFGKRWGESPSGPMGWLCFQEHYNDAADEIDTLRAKLEECKRAGFIDDKGFKLPMSVDGVLLRPGMKVWRMTDADCDGTPFEGFDIGSLRIGMSGRWTARIDAIGDVNINCLYSSRATALTAHSQAKTEEGGA